MCRRILKTVAGMAPRVPMIPRRTVTRETAYPCETEVTVPENSYVHPSLLRMVSNVPS